MKAMNEIFSEIGVPDLSEEQKSEWNDRIERFDAETLERYVNDKFAKCGLGTEYLGCSFGSFRTDSPGQLKMKNSAMKFCTDVKGGKPMNLVLSGSCGTGKTHICAAILREFAGYVREYAYDLPVYSTIRYATIFGISDELYRSPSRSSVLSGYRNYDILVIDEVGRQVNRFENEADLLFQIVDARYQAGKSTVFATNIKGKKIGSYFNEATASRLKASGRLIYCDSQDIPDQRNSGNKIHTA